MTHSGPGPGDGNPQALNQRPDKATRDSIRQKSSLWQTAREAVKLGGQSLQWEIRKQSDLEEVAEMANCRGLFCNEGKAHRLLESYQALIRRGANALPLCCQEYYYHPDNIWMLVPCAIVRVRRKAKDMWEVGYFRGDLPTSLFAGFVSDEIIQWLLTTRAYRMVMKSTEENTREWKRVSKLQYHQSFLDTLYYIKARPKADGGVEFLARGKDNWLVSYDEEDVSAGDQTWQALKKEIDIRREQKNPSILTFPCAISAPSVQKAHLVTHSGFVYAHPRVEIKFKQVGGNGSYYDPLLIASALASYASYIRYPSSKVDGLFHALAQVKMDRSYEGRCASILLEHLNYIRLELASFDPLTHDAIFAVVAKLQSTKWNRCVVFYKGMIFEPSFEFALEITEHNLHNICGGASCYSGIAWAYGFRKKKKRERKRRGSKPSKTNPRAGLINETSAASQASTFMVSENKSGQAKVINGDVGGTTSSHASLFNAPGGENNFGISKEEGSKENLVVHNGKHDRVLLQTVKETGCDECSIENPPTSLIGSSLLATLNS